MTAFVRTGQEDVLAPYATALPREAAQVHDRLGTQRAQVALLYGFPMPLAWPELVEQVDAWLATPRRTRAPSGTSASDATRCCGCCAPGPRDVG